MEDEYNSVLEKLAELEEYFFYKSHNPGDLGEMYHSIEMIHHNIKAELERWHRITGAKLK